MIEEDDEAFMAAFDRREGDRISSSLDLAFRSVGFAADPSEAERTRVSAIIDRDRRYVARENARALAELEVREGVYVNISDIVVEPTEEWRGQGQFQRFVPRQPNGTVRTIATVRRVLTPVIKRMWSTGKLSDEQFAACSRYRRWYEEAGLEGRWSTTRFNSVSGGSGGGASPVAQHAREAENREAFRSAREAIAARYRNFFDKIVIDDVPPLRAARFAQCRRARAEAIFRLHANELVTHCERVGVDLDIDLKS